MIVFLTICYCAILFLLVRLKIVPFNTFWKASPVLWMVVLLIILFIPMQWGAPSGPIRIYQSVVEVQPNVSGEVIEVPVKPLVPLSKGDVLFKLDPVLFQATVDQKRAALAEARQSVPQLKAALDAAEAALDESEAVRDRAKDDFDRLNTANQNASTAGNRSLPFSESDVEQRRLTFVAAEAAVSRATANVEQSRLAYASEIDGVNTTVARLEAELRSAEYNLKETVVTAPSDGYVVALTLQPGQRVTQFAIRSWMAFVPEGRQQIAVALPQTRLRHVEPGQPAEITLAVLPGEILDATVVEVIRVNASAQLQPSGILPSLGSHNGPNELMGVVLELKSTPAVEIPAGAGGSAAIYTNTVEATHIIRKVMIRMDAWLNYLRPN